MTVIICKAGHRATVDDSGTAADCACITSLRAEVASLKVKLAMAEANDERKELGLWVARLEAEVASLKAERDDMRTAYEEEVARCVASEAREKGLREALDEARRTKALSWAETQRALLKAKAFEAALEHVRHCLECGETDMSHCDEGRKHLAALSAHQEPR